MKRVLFVLMTLLLMFNGQLSAQETPQDVYQERWNSPYVGDRKGSSSSEIPRVSRLSGAVSLSVSDCSFMDKGGFGFTLQRHYSSQEAIAHFARHRRSVEELYNGSSRAIKSSYNAYSLGGGWSLTLPMETTDNVILLPNGGVMKLSQCRYTEQQLGAGHDNASTREYFDADSKYRYICTTGLGSAIKENWSRVLVNPDGTTYTMNREGLVKEITSPDRCKSITIHYKDLSSDIPQFNNNTPGGGLVTDVAPDHTTGIDYIEDNIGRRYVFSYCGEGTDAYIDKVTVEDPSGGIFCTIDYRHRDKLETGGIDYGLLTGVAMINSAGEERVLGEYSYQDFGGVWDSFVWNRIHLARLDGSLQSTKGVFLMYIKGYGAHYEVDTDRIKIEKAYEDRINPIERLFLLNQSWGRGSGGRCVISWKRTVTPEHNPDNTNHMLNLFEALSSWYTYTDNVAHKDNGFVYGGYLRRSFYHACEVRRYTGRDTGNDNFRKETYGFDFDIVGQKWNSPHNEIRIFGEAPDLSGSYPGVSAIFFEGLSLSKTNNMTYPLVAVRYANRSTSVTISDTQQEDRTTIYNYTLDEEQRLESQYRFNADGTGTATQYMYEAASGGHPVLVHRRPFDSSLNFLYSNVLTEMVYDRWMNVTEQKVIELYHDADGEEQERTSITRTRYNSESDDPGYIDEVYAGTHGLITGNWMEEASMIRAVNLPLMVETEIFVEGQDGTYRRGPVYYGYDLEGRVTQVASCKRQVDTPASGNDFLTVLYGYNTDGDLKFTAKGGPGTINILTNIAYSEPDAADRTYTKEIRTSYRDQNDGSRTDTVTCDVMTNLPLETVRGANTGSPYKTVNRYDNWWRIAEQDVPSPLSPQGGSTRKITVFGYEDLENGDYRVDKHYSVPVNTHSVLEMTSFSDSVIYTNNNKVREVTRGGHVKMMLEHNASGRVIKKQYPDVRTLNSQDGAPRVDRFHYTGNGSLKRVVSQAGESWAEETRSTLFNYDYINNYVESYMEGDDGTTSGITRSYLDLMKRVHKTVVDPGGLAVTNRVYYNADGSVALTVDGEGHKTQYHYGAQGMLEHIAFPAVDVYTLNRSDEGQAGSLSIDKNVHYRVDYTYDEYDRLAEKSGMHAFEDNYAKQHYSYDGLGRVVKAELLAAEGSLDDEVWSSREYDRFGRTVRIENQSGARVTYAYDNYSHVLRSVTDPEGNRYTYEYDTLGNKIRETDPRNTNSDYPGSYSTSYRYNYNSGAVDSIVFPRNNNAADDESVVKYGYALDGRRSIAISPEMRFTSYTYTPFGQPESVCASIASKETHDTVWLKRYEYDSLGRLVRTRERDGQSIAYAYDRANRVYEITDSSGGKATLEYDGRGKVVKKRVLVSTGIEEVHAYTYDGLGRLTAMVKPDGREYSYGYDDRGNRVFEKDARGIERRYRYDLQNRLVDEYDNEWERTAHYEYGDDGRLSARTDKAGTTFEYDYSANGNLVEERVVSSVGATVCTRTIERDEVGSIKRIDEEDRNGDTVVSVKYNHDNEGRYAPDVNGHVRRRDVAVSNSELGLAKTVSTSFAYDRDGLLTSITYPHEERVSYTYDRLGRVTGVNDGEHEFISSVNYRDSSSSQAVITEYGNMVRQHSMYRTEVDGRMIGDAFSSVLNVDSSSLETGYEYDLAGRLTKKTDTFMTSDYQYGANHALKNVTSQMPMWNDFASGWDLVEGRNLTCSTSMEYDDGGNMLSKSTTITGGGQITSQVNYAVIPGTDRYAQTIFSANDVEDYIYDAMGNVSGVMSGFASDLDRFFDVAGDRMAAPAVREQSLVFNEENRLTGSQLGMGPVVHNVYGSDGLRIARYREGSEERTYYAYMGNELLYEESEDGSSTQYVYLDGRMIGYITHDALTGESTRYYTRTDHLGSVVNSLDEDGNLLGAAGYTEHGDVMYKYGEDIPRIWAGKKFDEDMGLYYFNARWYDPGQARFISEDPVKDGENWYAYCGNDPVNYVDSNGLQQSEAWNNFFNRLGPSASKNFGVEFRTSLSLVKLKDVFELSMKGIFDSNMKIAYQVQARVKVKLKGIYVGALYKGKVGVDFMKLFGTFDSNNNFTKYDDETFNEEWLAGNFDHIIKELKFEEFIGAEFNVPSELKAECKAAIEAKGNFHELLMQLYNRLFSVDDFTLENLDINGIGKVTWPSGPDETSEARVKFDLTSFLDETISQLAFDLELEKRNISLENSEEMRKNPDAFRNNYLPDFSSPFSGTPLGEYSGFFDYVEQQPGGSPVVSGIPTLMIENFDAGGLQGGHASNVPVANVNWSGFILGNDEATLVNLSVGPEELVMDIEEEDILD